MIFLRKGDNTQPKDLARCGSTTDPLPRPAPILRVMATPTTLYPAQERVQVERAVPCRHLGCRWSGDPALPTQHSCHSKSYCPTGPLLIEQEPGCLKLAQTQYSAKGHFTKPDTISCLSPTPHRLSTRGEQICISPGLSNMLALVLVPPCARPRGGGGASHLLLFCLHPLLPGVRPTLGCQVPPWGRAVCLPSHTPACCHVPFPTKSHTDKRPPRFHSPGTRGLG